ncbi:RusA family crossover junction endodeoxyribonuclease [Afifella marina]|uniref:Endodeoxyribonuclease RusA n=1 Tax=Afifella marina DSM 2698 TaxID=1120955 RepID=A0A1G5P9S6_AFIMA|nr:RusA family crossover junction endodeoxyribonuclease [Afifella marina]MBK1624358.1 RusA family crossover junction endodeoxyribonuclease [Afifella marina DSM 2698]MBK1628090.1 RusA family crossover junction endodeoxyribonuclease [Afifella marina]MBK5916524.1 hypothetical protein [Afifella marina]RAI18898.1 hypothetical protein CH311_13550 [Afifella marina DSM 2698]SCZ46245.1 Endodeoxyribonuclease RusA [Afifella marina DSM 2698]
MADEESLYPIEVVLRGTPISLQSKSSAHREAWKQRVRDATLSRREQVYQAALLDDRPLAVTIYYFPSDPMEGDIDNIVKPIVDAMKGVSYLDDRSVERIAAQKFEPEEDWQCVAPTEQLAFALDMEPPVIYIRVEDDLHWRRFQ